MSAPIAHNPSDRTDGALLNVDQLAVGFGARVVAREISFALHAGNAIAVLGPNGAGKTTLFRTLLGALPAIAGEVRVAGRLLGQLSITEMARRIAYVPQHVGGLQHFLVREVVEMARAPTLAWYAQPGKVERDAALNALNTLGISRLADALFAQLSGGERQLVLVARALCGGANCLLLDEPTASLDFGNRLHVQDALLTLKARGYALLFTTHEPTQARELASGYNDRTLAIARDGSATIDATGTATCVERLAALYGVEVARLRHIAAK
jgi:iron complex transport system ATP-binding protein